MNNDILYLKIEDFADLPLNCSKEFTGSRKTGTEEEPSSVRLLAYAIFIVQRMFYIIQDD